jgi:membrane-associated phospholipid phosphatase
MRPYEWVLIAYFTYTAVVAQVLPAVMPVPVVIPLLNLTVIASLYLLAFAHSLRGSLLLGIMRDWFVFPLLLLAYREMGWMARPILSHDLEAQWVVWDRVVLQGGLKAAVEVLGPVLPGLLEICYVLVYVTGMFGMAMLYAYRRRERAARFLYVVVPAVLLCYVQFPFWPSEPPRAVFPGELFPAYDTVFRRFNWWMLAGQGIHTSVFPSAHVAGAFGAAFGMWKVLPEHPWVGRFLLVLAVLIATATVYGRYHYLADAMAGFVVAVVAFAIGGRGKV